MHLSLGVEQSQHLHLTPALEQGIAVMAMSTLEVHAFLERSLFENPFLKRDETFPAEDKEPTSAPPDPYAEDAGDEEDPLEPPIRSAGQSTLTDPDHIFERLPTHQQSLEVRILEQISLELRAQRDLAIAQWILGALDGRGYLFVDTSIIASYLGVSIDQVERVLKKIQTECVPAGIAARDLRECLLAQLDAQGSPDVLTRTIISDHLQDLADGRINYIAETLGVPPAHVKDSLDAIRRLDPHPAAINTGYEAAILPEVSVALSEDQWVVKVTDSMLPQVVVDRDLEGKLNPKALDGKAIQRMKQLVKEAEGVIRAVDLRKASLLSVTSAIVEAQEAFFDEGPSAMRPLTMLEVAQAAEVSEATVSRIAKHAYMDTPRGTFPLRGFFSSAVGGSLIREDISSIAAKEAIKEIIDGEDPYHPLSDAKIVEALEERDLFISRRTVNKYRDALGILSAPKRKIYRQ